TVLDEFPDGGFQQPHAAVVAVQLDVAGEGLDRLEAHPVLAGRHDFDVLPLVEDDLGAEVAHAERDGLAVVAVGRVADQPGPGIGLATEDKHAECSNHYSPRPWGERGWG